MWSQAVRYATAHQARPTMKRPWSRRRCLARRVGRRCREPVRGTSWTVHMSGIISRQVCRGRTWASPPRRALRQERAASNRRTGDGGGHSLYKRLLDRVPLYEDLAHRADWPGGTCRARDYAAGAVLVCQGGERVGRILRGRGRRAQDAAGRRRRARYGPAEPCRGMERGGATPWLRVISMLLLNARMWVAEQLPHSQSPLVRRRAGEVR